MPNVNTPAKEAILWLRTGFERVRSEQARWLGMTLVFVVIALLLKWIPFLGNFVLVLLTPIMLAGGLLAARDTSPVAAPVDAKSWLRALTLDAARELFQVFRREENTFAIVIVCIVALGLVVVVSIPELLITGGAIVSGLAGAKMAGPIQPTTLIGMAIVTTLYLLLVMGLLYLVPLALFRHRQAIPAVMESFGACWRNAIAVAVFIAPFFLINLLILFAFSQWHWLGYMLLIILGGVGLPTFVVSLNASYHSLFEPVAAVASDQ